MQIDVNRTKRKTSILLHYPFHPKGLATLGVLSVLFLGAAAVAYHAGRGRGLEEGYESGEAEGLRAGEEAGFQQGQQEGLQLGRQNGLQEGRQEGRQEGLQQGQVEGIQKGIALTVRSVDPLTSSPFFIFRKRVVAWAELAPDLEVALAGHLRNTPLEIAGTFSVPGDYDGSDLSGVTADDTSLTFPRYGEFYLRTTIGNLKLLLLDPALSADQQIVGIGRFVSKNCVHSLADGRLIQPNLGYYPYQRPDKLLRKFFASDQPLALHCGYVVEFLNYVLRTAGFQTQRVQLYTEDRKAGHIVAQVRDPQSERWILIDPDYGAIVRGEDRRCLSIQQVQKFVAEGRADRLCVEDVGNKCWVQADYNLPSQFMPPFAWTVDAMSFDRAVVPEQYQSMLGKYTREIVVYEYDQTLAWHEVERRRARSR
jgi:hypothetical protein